MAVGLIFLISTIALLAFTLLSVFFIVFGILKKLKGFLIAGIVMILLFVMSVVSLFLMNMVMIR